MSVAVLGGCTTQARKLVAPDSGAVTAIGPNSPWNPTYDWLTPEPASGQAELAALLDDHRVVRRANELARKRGRALNQTLARSRHYHLMVQRELRAHGVPVELASVPVIESGYVPNALGRWVAGLWQFTRDTARAYGLTVDGRTDQRRDPERSTRAAASYLRDLYERFGRWDLALAGYNAGPGRVEEALRRRPGASFFELSERGLLPERTRHYVPDVLATALVVSHPERFGLKPVGEQHASVLSRLAAWLG